MRSLGVEWGGASVLAEWLRLPEMAAAGAVGPGPAAAVVFWLQYGESKPQGSSLGGSEDLLAALSWYFAVRAETAAGWGAREPEPLVVDAEQTVRLDADRRRWLAPLSEADRAARQVELGSLLENVLDLARRLAKAESKPVAAQPGD